jgi:fermentation-respiration switch protein FrsA (DUF1100 family)
VFRFSLEVIGALLVLALVVRFLEPRLAFLPTKGEDLTPRDFGVDYEVLTIKTADGESLRAWKLLNPRPHSQIVYFHGNGGNLSNWAPILARIAQQGFSVIAVDYRGYGASTGRPTERGLYRDVDAVVQAFWAGSSPAMPVIYWGRSLGTVMAAYAAKIRRPDGLILESGFPDARSLVRASPVLAALAIFSTYRFPCAEFLKTVAAPVLVIHGDDDHVIPIAHGRELFSRIASPKQFVTIRGGDHNDVTPRDPQAYWEAVRQFSETLRAHALRVRTL